MIQNLENQKMTQDLEKYLTELQDEQIILKKSLKDNNQKTKDSPRCNQLAVYICLTKRKIEKFKNAEQILNESLQNVEEISNESLKNVEEIQNKNVSNTKLVSLIEKMYLLKKDLKINSIACRRSKQYHTLQKAIWRCRKNIK